MLSGTSAKTTLTFLLLAACAGLLSACGLGGDAAGWDGAAPGTYPVDNLFTDFYESLGGVDVLGPAISPLKAQGNLQLQTVEAGQMVYDPQASNRQPFSLVALGRRLGYTDPPSPPPQDPNARYIDGHTIYPLFIPLYDQLGGSEVLGSPLTEVYYSATKNRFTQHFENVGFYLSLDQTQTQPGLLAYGLFACDYPCRYQPPIDALIESQPQLPQPFAGEVARLGSSFVGEYLAGPYQAADGKIEVIFENIVLYVEQGDSQRALARPIVELVGYPAQPLAERVDDPLVVFYPIENERGHNILALFNDYIARHGSLEVTGLPISEVFPLEDGAYRQCFEHLCLDYREEAQEYLRVRPAPLGALYKDQYYDLPTLENGAQPQEGQTIKLNTWEEYASVTSSDIQTIHASVFENDLPASGITPMLTLTLPDGSLDVHLFPPTGENGHTKVAIPPINAPNGTLIRYEVCVEITEDVKVCTTQSYPIWGNP